MSSPLSSNQTQSSGAPSFALLRRVGCKLLVQRFPMGRKPFRQTKKCADLLPPSSFSSSPSPSASPFASSPSISPGSSTNTSAPSSGPQPSTGSSSPSDQNSAHNS